MRRSTDHGVGGSKKQGGAVESQVIVLQRAGAVVLGCCKSPYFFPELTVLLCARRAGRLVLRVPRRTTRGHPGSGQYLTSKQEMAKIEAAYKV